MAEITYAGLYYAFNSKIINKYQEKDKLIDKVIIGHNHAHTFEEVIKNLYDFPETFSLPEKDKKYYSNQELNFIRRVKKYLLFIGLKDLKPDEDFKERYINKLNKKCDIFNLRESEKLIIDYFKVLEIFND